MNETDEPRDPNIKELKKVAKITVFNRVRSHRILAPQL